MQDVKCLANEPGPVVEVGPHVKDNAILAVIPNNGHGKFNYAEKIEFQHCIQLLETMVEKGKTRHHS